MISNLRDLPTQEDVFGNKARNLSILINQGILVPEGIAVSFEHYLEYIASGKLSPYLREELSKTLGKIPGPYAVRSSANVEDSGKRSYAGQFRTVLEVSIQNICDAVKEVYNSGRDFDGVYADTGIQMGVLIQQMIPADISGVIFTYDIVNQTSDSLLVELAQGSCDSIVSGKTNPSMYIIRKDSGEIIFFEEGDQNVVLSEEHKLQILGNASRIEKVFKKPQDIEFLINSDKFYSLQSRDITTI